MLSNIRGAGQTLSSGGNQISLRIHHTEAKEASVFSYRIIDQARVVLSSNRNSCERAQGRHVATSKISSSQNSRYILLKNKRSIFILRDGCVERFRSFELDLSNNQHPDKCRAKQTCDQDRNDSPPPVAHLHARRVSILGSTVEHVAEPSLILLSGGVTLYTLNGTHLHCG